MVKNGKHRTKDYLYWLCNTEDTRVSFAENINYKSFSYFMKYLYLFS